MKYVSKGRKKVRRPPAIALFIWISSVVLIFITCAKGDADPILSAISPSPSINQLLASATTTDSPFAYAVTPAPPTFKFNHRVYNVSIAENSVGKTYAAQPPNEERLGIAIAHDMDVKYRITGGDKEKLFKAEERIVGDFAFLAIRTRTGNVVLNREKIDEYRLDIRATGTYRESKMKIVVEAECTVHVTVLDTNDLSPLFYPSEYSVVVPEDIPLHKSITRVIAEDADLGINGEIYYSFLEETDYFAVHPTTGVITLTRPLKFTDRSFHELIVVATDRGSASSQINRLSRASKAKVKVQVKQVSKRAKINISFVTLTSYQVLNYVHSCQHCFLYECLCFGHI